MKIKIGDTVKLLAGKDHGKTGKVIQIFKDSERVVVENVNQLVKHLKPRGKAEKGKKVSFSAPMHISNIQFQCPKCKKYTRLGVKTLQNGKRIRVCKKCQETAE